MGKLWSATTRASGAETEPMETPGATLHSDSDILQKQSGQVAAGRAVGW